MKYNREFDKLEEYQCLHDSCPNCKGTGRTVLGHVCAHALVCKCPKCIIS